MNIFKIYNGKKTIIVNEDTFREVVLRDIMAEIKSNKDDEYKIERLVIIYGQINCNFTLYVKSWFDYCDYPVKLELVGEQDFRTNVVQDFIKKGE